MALGYYVSGSKSIGYYFTKDKAIATLKLYNETGKRIPSDLLRRINGSGCVCYINRCEKWQAIGSNLLLTPDLDFAKNQYSQHIYFNTALMRCFEHVEYWFLTF